MNRIVGYVNYRDFLTMEEADILALDVINIAFGQIKNNEITWPAASECQEGIARLRKVNPAIKVLLSIGGWSAGGFSETYLTEEGREAFANSCVKIVTENNLDGIDLDWEYPCTSLAGIGSDYADKENYTAVCKLMREKFDEVNKDYMVTIAAGGDTYFTLQVDFVELSKYLDYVQLMTYDLQGGFQKVTGHHAALYQGRTNLYDVCVDKAVRVFHAAGVPMEKLIVGYPFYSRKWDGVKEQYGRTGLGIEADTVGGYGPDYGELVANYVNKNGYVRHWDNEAKAPYLFNGSTLISYEDEESLNIKLDYIKEKNLGGIMFWEYKCDPTRTLLAAMAKGLK